MGHPREAEGRRPCLPLVGMQRQHPEKGSSEGEVGGKTAFFSQKNHFSKFKNQI